MDRSRWLWSRRQFGQHPVDRSPVKTIRVVVTQLFPFILIKVVNHIFPIVPRLATADDIELPTLFHEGGYPTAVFRRGGSMPGYAEGVRALNL